MIQTGQMPAGTRLGCTAVAPSAVTGPIWSGRRCRHQMWVVACIGFEDLRQDPIEPDDLRVIELREFRGHNLADEFGPASRDQDPPVPLSLHHPL